MELTAAQRRIAEAKWPAISKKTQIAYVPPSPPEWVNRPQTLDPGASIVTIHVTMHRFGDTAMGYCPQLDELLFSDSLKRVTAVYA